jgi:diguanylate cyclase (GGDEF)-like protein
MENLLKNAVEQHEKIDLEVFSTEDFKNVSSFANEMIDSIYENQEELKKANYNLESSVEIKTQELINLNKFLEDKNRELEKNFLVDQLTGLQNRNMFLKDLAGLENLAVAIIDIDGFKNINDFYGTKSGDKLLISISRFIKNYANHNAMGAYRLSSDEFVLCCYEKIEEKSLIKRLEKFLKLFAKEEFFDSTLQNKLNIDLTCGIAMGKENILEKADIALNFAKKKKMSFVIFDEKNPHMNTYKHNIYWREKIQWAINEDLIVPYFQPIINIKDKTLKKYEALMRIKDGDELITPYVFLDIAKETKLYPLLTKIMIEKTFAKFSHTNREFSLNITLLDIEEESTVAFLKEKIKEYDVATQLILEIVESEHITKSENFLPFVASLRKEGVRFALDDFGSGYSNFAFLLTMHPKFIKIDGSLVKRMVTDQQSYAIVETIVLFAQQMQATVIAEFVENEKIVRALENLGIIYMQGYYFSPPLEDADI